MNNVNNLNYIDKNTSLKWLLLSVFVKFIEKRLNDVNLLNILKTIFG